MNLVLWKGRKQISI